MEIVAPLKRYWWMILGMGAASALMAVIWQIRSIPIYSAYVVVGPSESAVNPSRMRSGGSGGLSRLAGAAGLKVGADEEAVSPFGQFKFLLKSPELAYFQMQRRPMLQIVFKGAWDSARHEWRRPTGLRSSVDRQINPIFGLPAWTPPSAESLAGTYSANLRLQSIPDSSLTRLIYEDPDPEMARFILSSMVRDANELLRQQARQEASVQVSYLRSRLALTDMQSYRDTLIDLLAEQEQLLMLTSGQLPFAARTIERVTVSNGPTSKRPMLFASISFILGLSFAAFVAIVADNRRRLREAMM